MPRNRNRSHLPTIAWLEHRTGFPSPEEREQIIQRRQVLYKDLFHQIFYQGVEEDDPAIQRLVRKYGPEEVRLMMRYIDKRQEAFDIFVQNDAFDYRLYRQNFARFGGQLPFLSLAEYNRLNDEFSRLVIDRFEKSEEHKTPREQELVELLFVHYYLWEDLIPEDVPARPSTTPEPVLRYKEPLATLLTYGSNLEAHPLFFSQLDGWRKHIQGLVNMALDPALLNGWPGDPASWAPWYALRLVGELGSIENIPALASLADQPNDWLSDLLPDVLGYMSPEAEPFLSIMVDESGISFKQRGLMIESLARMAANKPVIRPKIIHDFVEQLNRKQTHPTIAAWLIHFLEELDVHQEFQEEIAAAFDEERVDLNIVQYEDLDWGDE